MLNVFHNFPASHNPQNSQSCGVNFLLSHLSVIFDKLTILSIVKEKHLVGTFRLLDRNHRHKLQSKNNQAVKE